MYSEAGLGVVGPGLISGNSSALVDAFNANSLAISYSIAGFMMSYFVGTYAVLRELGIITDSTKVAGASSGGLMAVAHCAGISDRVGPILDDLSSICRTQHNCLKMLDDVLRPHLKKALPEDAYKSCSGNIWLSMTLDSFPSRHPKNVMVSEFKSNDDLVEAAAASAFIPVWSGKNLTTKFRGQQAYDGFFSNPQPCPPGVQYCVRISSSNPPWERTQLSKMFAILGRAATLGTGQPACVADTPAGGFKMDKPGKPETQQEKSDPAKKSDWDDTMSLPAAELLQLPLSKGVDVMPGVWSDTLMSSQMWADLLVLPGDQCIQKHLYQLGREDAEAWAAATGLKQAAAAKRTTAAAAAQQVSQGKHSKGASSD